MQISYEECENCHNEIAIVIENMKNIVDEIETKCTALKNNDIWKGPGASHYEYLLKRVLSNFEDMYDQLKKSNVFLEQSYSNYKALDNKLLTQLGGLGL